MFKLLLRKLVLFLLFAPAAALGHGGGLDTRGCHADRKAGNYHCHRGPHAGKTFPSKAAYPGGGSRPEGSGAQSYNRDLYPHWIDADGDCQDTRDEILIEHALSYELGPNACDVLDGIWRGPYTGERLTDPSDIHIDHVVPLKEAHISGAANWPRSRKRRFANDPANLPPSAAGANMSKGSDDPADWLPNIRRCQYVERWVMVKEKWGLKMDRAEKQAIARIRSQC